MIIITIIFLLSNNIIVGEYCVCFSPEESIIQVLYSITTEQVMGVSGLVDSPLTIMSKILKENPEHSFIVVISSESKYLIRDDNYVYTIYGKKDPILENVENLYRAYYNENIILSDKIFYPENVLVTSR